MLNLKIVELTKDNEHEYIDQVAELEKVVLAAMEKEGKEGQLFITGKEDIQEYIFSKENTVIVAVDNKGQVQSATYITQGQKPFTYNDITKYFKYGEGYKRYIKSQYTSPERYRKDLLSIYKTKIEAYKYAKRRILEEHPEFNGDIKKFLAHELEENQFHEKSVLRENINKYMAEYIEKLSKKPEREELKKLYEQFYWITLDDIEKEFGKPIDRSNTKEPDISEYEELMETDEYEEILQKGSLQIHEKPEFEEEQYYTANTDNSVEIDTYITDPNQRHAGIARILVYEGIKKHITQHFENEKNNEIFLCSTLHRDNLSSKYVSEFFGLTDQLFVKRRMGRDREVHICKIERTEAQNYLDKMQNKLAVLYGYNPEDKKIPEIEKRQIIEEQLKYETLEFKRLNKMRHVSKNYKGNVRELQGKANKIVRLKEILKKMKDMGTQGEDAR